MTSADPKVVRKLDELARELFAQQIASDTENARFKAAEATLKAEHEANMEPILAAMRQAGAKVWGLIGGNRDRLIAPGKKSFMTGAAKFQLRGSSAKLKVADSDGVMQVARQLGVIKKIANPPRRTWQLDKDKFFAWLEENPELREQFEEFLNETDAAEGLTIQPNGTFTVFHNKERVSPPPVKVEKP